MKSRTASILAFYLISLAATVSCLAPAPSPYAYIEKSLIDTALTPLPKVKTINAVYQPDVSYVSACNATDAPKNQSEWKRWSDAKTWINHPRIPKSGDDVQIYCGEFIIFDVPQMQLGLLEIYGQLAFLDDASRPQLSLSADSVLVFGVLSIGSATQHFRQQAQLTLTGNKLNQYVHPYEDVGFKALAVIGGQLRLFGMPNGTSTPAWAQLTQTAPVDATNITLDQNISGWPVGSKIAIATTDFDTNQTETVTITKVKGNLISFTPPLKYSHFAPGVPTGVNKIMMPMAAEVGLINRNIHITSTQEAPPNQLQGGHVIIYATQAKQSVVGVEFSYLGQQGTLGRYPLHFHLCGSIPNTTVQLNSVHDSIQRCYVIHGTHNLTISDSFAFNTTGHCFMLEDGIEMDNVFEHNLGLVNKPPQVLIPPENVAESDDDNTIFWSATPLNSWLNNTAAGGANGFWLQMQKVNGVSQSIRGASRLNLMTSPLTAFINNTAHSFTDHGLRTYKNGYHPKADAQATFEGFVAYKSQRFAMSCHNCENVTITNAMVSDSQTGVEMNRLGNNTLRNSIIIGLSENLGNPVACRSGSQACEPAIYGACPANFNQSSIKMAPGPEYRTVPVVFKRNTTGYYGWGFNMAGNNAINNTFVNFNNTCHKAGALGNNDVSLSPMSTLARASGSKFINVAEDQRWWVDPSLGPLTDDWYVAEDVDGSITGGNGSAYIVEANDSLLLPPTSQNSDACSLQPGWNAYVCRGVCYRGLTIKYDEPAGTGSSPNLLGTFPANQIGSYLSITRTADGANLISHSYNNATAANATQSGDFTFYPNGTTVWHRQFPLNLLSGYSYNVTVMNTRNGVIPTPITLTYSDTVEAPLNPPCNGLVAVSLPMNYTSVTTARG